MIELIGRLDLTHNLVHPLLGYVAVGTGRPYAGAVGEVDSLLQLLIDGVFHLVTGDTELLRVGHLHGGVEALSLIHI